MNKEQRNFNLLFYFYIRAVRLMVVGSAHRLRGVCIKLLGAVFIGTAQMYKDDVTFEMFTSCRSDHCFGKSRKLLIIWSNLVLGCR